MKFSSKEKMRSIMFRNYPCGQNFKICFKYSFNKFTSIYRWILTKITNFIFKIWNLVWLVENRHSTLKNLKEIFLMKKTSLVFQNSKFYNTKTILRSLFLKISPQWSLTQIDMVQIGLESRLDFLFDYIFWLDQLFREH